MTTITIDLPPDLADRLTRKAARQGSDAAALVRQLAEREAEMEKAIWDPPTLAAWDTLLDSFAEGSEQDHRETVAALAQGLNDDRPGQRRVFGEGANPDPSGGQSAE